MHKLTNPKFVKCIFWFSLKIILRIILHDTAINVHRISCKLPVISCKVPVILCKLPVILVRFWWNLKFSRQIFGKYSSIKFNKYPPNGSRDGPCGQMDRHDEAYTRFLAILRMRLKMLPLFIFIFILFKILASPWKWVAMWMSILNCVAADKR
jgi:hypothetical protein